MDEDGFDYPSPDAATAAAMQAIVWDVVSNYGYAKPQEPLGLARYERLYAISVVPNPTTDRVTLSVQSEGGIESVRVLDQAGRLVRATPVALGASSASIQLSGLAAGMYFLEVETASGVAFEKVVKR